MNITSDPNLRTPTLIITSPIPKLINNFWCKLYLSFNSSIEKMFSVLRRVPKSRIAFLGIFNIGDHSNDVVTTPGYEDLQPKYRGFAGVKRIFMADEYGAFSQELSTMMHMCSLSCLTGVLYGAFAHGRAAWYKFVENNEASAFSSQFEAKRKLQDRVTLSMGRGALTWGVRIGGFTSTFIVLNTILRVFRGEPGIVEWVGAGCITGALFKFNLGPKGMMAGTVVGGFLGFLGGAASMILMYMSGFTMDDIEKTQHAMHKSRNDAIRHGMKLQMMDEADKLNMENAIKAGDMPKDPKNPLQLVEEDRKESVQ